jgi:hypothetical protein
MMPPATHTIYQILCCYFVICYCRTVTSAMAAMVQPHHNFPLFLEHPTQQLQRFTVSAAPITHRPPLTRFHFILMSCSSVILSPAVLLADALELETTDEGRISMNEREFVLSTKLGMERIGKINTNRRSPSSNAIDFIPTNNKEPLYYPTFMFGAWNVTVKLKQCTTVQNSVVVSTDIATTSSSAPTTQYFQRFPIR